MNLNTLIKLKPAVLHLGHKGSMLLARFLSVPGGLDYLLESNYIQPELEKWYKVRSEVKRFDPINSK